MPCKAWQTPASGSAVLEEQTDRLAPHVADALGHLRGGHALEVVAGQEGFQVLHAEVGLALLVTGPWPAHEDFVAIHCLLYVGAELFKQVVEAAGDAGVFAGLGDLLALNHFLEQAVEHGLPVLPAQRGRQDVNLVDAGFLERGLVEEAFCVELYAFAVDIEEPKRGLAVVLGQRGQLWAIWPVGPDPKFAGPAQAAVAKAVEGRVLALVLVVFLVKLLDDDLHFVVGQRWGDVLEVVLNELIFPLGRGGLLEVQADVEDGVVACALWDALCAQGLQAWWAVFDGCFSGLWRLWRIAYVVLDVGIVERVELFQACGFALCGEGVASAVVPAKVGQIQEVAGIAAVNKDFGLLGENLSPGLAQESGGILEIFLELARGEWRAGEEKDMGATRLAAAHDKGQVQVCNLGHQARMVQRILIDVDAAPDAGVVCADRDDAQGGLSAF